MKHQDIGKTFGKLTCIGYGEPHVSPRGKSHRTMLCVCACGQEKEALAASIRSGRTTSCGCAKRDSSARLKHGHSRQSGRHPLYTVWGQMRSRCNNPSTPGYKHYGGRGIKCCPQWDSFEVFVSDMGNRPDGFTLDRIDVNGDYEPRNCRWADRRTQANNTTRSVRYAYEGEEMSLEDVSARTGVNLNTLRVRLFRGWSFERAIQK